MKKLFIFILCLITLSGCQTQEEIKKQKEQEELNKIKNEVQNSEIPEEVKTWTYDVKTKKLSTVFCISTSKKCADFKTTLEAGNIWHISRIMQFQHCAVCQMHFIGHRRRCCNQI